MTKLHKILIAMLFIALTVLTVSLFWRQTNLLVILLLVLTVIKEKLSPTKMALVWFVVSSVLGPTMESLIINFGKNPWTYAAPDYLNVPIWLFPLYGLVGVILVTLYNGIINSK